MSKRNRVGSRVANDNEWSAEQKGREEVEVLEKVLYLCD
jgi:hypothetical protein